MDIIAQIDGQAGTVRTLLASEVLSKAALDYSLNIIIEIIAVDIKKRLPLDNKDDTIYLLISDDDDWQQEETKHYSGGIIHLSFHSLFENSENALAFLKNNTLQPQINEATKPDLAKKIKKIVAVTSCPTGIAHTFMAAEGLNVAAKALGYEIRVETQGSVGAGTPLTPEEISESDLVIIAADREVDLSRFAGKPLFAAGTKAAINNGQAFIEKAIAQAKTLNNKDAEAQDTTIEQKSTFGIYKHVMTGVSFMIPFIMAGSLLVAIGAFIGGEANIKNYLATAFTIIGDSGLQLFAAVLAGYIGFSIADRPAIAPGMIGGFFAYIAGAGFLGAIVAGFIAGYTILLAIKFIRLPKDLQGLMPVLVLPLIGTVITALLMIYVLGQPIAYIFSHLIAWLNTIPPIQAIILGALMGGVMSFDMGGPINKAAYATSVCLVGSQIYTPMAAVMIGGMTPPLALALACVLFPDKFTDGEKASKMSTTLLGLVFISEGAIAFAKRDPLRVIPSLVIGSAVAGAFSFAMGVGLRAPHGGIFLAFIPGAINNYFGYFLALIVGVIISVIALWFLKKTVTQTV